MIQRCATEEEYLRLSIIVTHQNIEDILEAKGWPWKFYNQESIGQPFPKMLTLLWSSVTNVKEPETYQEDETPLHGILQVKLLDVWGIDFMGSLMPSNNNLCILVAIDYVQKMGGGTSIPNQ